MPLHNQLPKQKYTSTMISNTEPKMRECNVLSQQMNADNVLSFELKANPKRLKHGESEEPCKFKVLAKRKLSFQLQSFQPLGGKIRVRFENRTTDACETSDPPPKRRRFQRRNSQTPKMLSMSTLPVIALDLKTAETTKACSEYDEDIEIAEDLVRLVQASRKRAQTTGFSIVKS